MKKWIWIGIIILVIFLIAAIPFIVKLGDRTPSIPRQEKSSLGDLTKAVDFTLKYPTSRMLNQTGSNVHYYVTTIPNPSNIAFSKPVITGYSISLTSKTGNIEYRGTHLAREGEKWSLFSTDNYTFVKEETAVEYNEGCIMYYSEYRPYPFNDYEKKEQMGLGEGFDEYLPNSLFTIFHAYVDVEGIRYSVIYSDMNYSETLESECIENAKQYFKSLL